MSTGSLAFLMSAKSSTGSGPGAGCGRSSDSTERTHCRLSSTSTVAAHSPSAPLKSETDLRSGSRVWCGRRMVALGWRSALALLDAHDRGEIVALLVVQGEPSRLSERLRRVQPDVRRARRRRGDAQKARCSPERHRPVGRGAWA